MGPDLEAAIEDLKKAESPDLDLLAAAILGDPENLTVAHRLGSHIGFAINQALEEAHQKGMERMVATTFVCSELSMALAYMMAATIHAVAHRVSPDSREKAYAMGMESIPAMLIQKMTNRLPELVAELREAQEKHDASCKAKKEAGNAESSQSPPGS